MYHNDQFTIAPGDLAPSSGIHGNLHSSAHILYPTHTKQKFKIKILKITGKLHIMSINLNALYDYYIHLWEYDWAIQYLQFQILLYCVKYFRVYFHISVLFLLLYFLLFIFPMVSLRIIISIFPKLSVLKQIFFKLWTQFYNFYIS